MDGTPIPSHPAPVSQSANLTRLSHTALTTHFQNRPSIRIRIEAQAGRDAPHAHSGCGSPDRQERAENVQTTMSLAIPHRFPPPDDTDVTYL